MELIVCMMLASLITGFRPISDMVHALKGQEPPHLTKARLRAETEKAKAAARQAKAENRGRRPGDDKPTIGDVARVYWGDALQDAIDAHDRRRAEKKAQQAENRQAAAEQRPAEKVRPGWRERLARLRRLLARPVGDPEPAVPEQRQPASENTVVEQVHGALDSEVVETGPRIACDECDATLATVDGGWEHPAGSTCPKARHWARPQTTATGRPVAAPQPAAAPASGSRHGQCPRCGDVTDLAHNGACHGCLKRPGSSREFWQRHVDAAKAAYERGDWETADDHLAAIEAHMPRTYNSRDSDDTRVSIRKPGADTRVNNGYERLFLTDWRHDIQQRLAADNQGDTMTDTNTTTSGAATGDAYNVETALHECNLLTDDLTRIDTALDVIDDAITNAGSAAEKIEAFLASKNVDDCAVGGMATARDMLSPERIKALIDAVAAAKQGVANTEQELRRLQDLQQQLNGADGSVLTGS